MEREEVGRGQKDQMRIIKQVTKINIFIGVESVRFRMGRDYRIEVWEEVILHNVSGRSGVLNENTTLVSCNEHDK